MIILNLQISLFYLFSWSKKAKKEKPVFLSRSLKLKLKWTESQGITTIDFKTFG